MVQPPSGRVSKSAFKAYDLFFLLLALGIFGQEGNKLLSDRYGILLCLGALR